MDETTVHNQSALSIVSSLCANPTPPRGEPVDLPDAAGDEAVACDGCERVVHVSISGISAEPDDEWLCEECVLNGVTSKRWPLGNNNNNNNNSNNKKRRLLGSYSGEASPSGKHTPADTFFAGLPFGASVTYLNSLNARLEKASCHSVELSFEDTFCDKDLVDMGASHVEKDIATNSLFLQFSDVLPVQYDDFFVLSLGRVDIRPSYHTVNQIWPIGYRSCFHDKITGSIFICNVLEAGDRGPIFKISRSSCSSLPIPCGSTLFIALKNNQNNADFRFDEEENSNLEMLISDPPTENDSRCCLENPPEMSANDISSLSKDVIGDFIVEESSPALAWKMVAKKIVDLFRGMQAQENPLNFCCEHAGDYKNEESYTSLDKFSGFSASFKLNYDGLNTETVLEQLRTWLEQDRFGLEVEFVHEILEFLPGVGACCKYTPIKKRSSYSSYITVGDGHFLVKTKGGKHMKGDGALNILFGNCEKAKTETVQEPVMKRRNLPIGKPLCPKVPSGIVGDVIQVLEFFRRFLETLNVGDTFSVEQLETELSSPFLEDHENSCVALNIAHMSLLNILNSQLQAKVSLLMDPSSDIRESKPKRGRKKSMEFPLPVIGKSLNMPPLNELTWLELTRRYLLAMLSMEDKFDTLQYGKVYRCLVGDGGELCGSLPGVLSMEADALLLAQAIKKIFGSLDREYDMLTIDDEGADQPTASQSSNPPEGLSNPTKGDIPEWAQLLQPVRKLPTNVGARIRNCIHAALGKSPPEWAKIILENSICKEVYKGNACGPTKKAVVSVLATVCGEEEGQKPVKQRKKTNKEKKGRKYVSISDIIMRQCRIVLRQVANIDSEKVFCNLLSRRKSNITESEDEGFLNCPANVSRPLDMRTIDLRLAVGAYDGSHEAFLEDVQEFWNHARISTVEKPDIFLLVNDLSSKFEELYEKKVLALYHKLVGYARLGCLSPEWKKEVDEFVISSCILPKAPWEANICKICGIDKNDDLVLLCDTCDAEYHTYCLNPPLLSVPQGNWHCPSCVSKLEDGNGTEKLCCSANLASKRKSLGEFTGIHFNSIARLVSLLEDKDYWEFSVEERTSLLKFLSDELLNSALIRQHLDRSMESFSDLQQKLRSFYIDLRNMKQRREKLSGIFAKTSKDSHLETNELFENPSTLAQGPSEFSLGDSSEYKIELSSIQNSIMHICESISGLEMQVMKLSGRREFLGADSEGRLYWMWAKLERKLCIIVNDVTTGSSRNSREQNDEPTLCSPWVLYQSLSELRRLVDFLRDEDPIEIQLKGLILRRLKTRFEEADNKGMDENKTQDAFFSKGVSDSELLATKGAGFLENAHGPWVELDTVLMNKKSRKADVISDDKLFRCSCLEPVLPFEFHCLSCHKSFSTKRESDGHSDDQCKSGFKAPYQSKSDSSSKGGGNFVVFPKLKNLEINGLICPYNFEDICSKFVTMDSLKDLVREIGLIGSNGVPLFLPNVSPILTDPTLKLNNNIGSLGSSCGGEPGDNPGPDKPDNLISDKKDEKLSGDKYRVVPKSAMKPLVGKAYQILIQLKMSLLDMEAALPKTAVRVSKTCVKRRWAWRSFVKSAGTIDEMVQAVIAFEDMIKDDHLKTGWWYWSSFSAAAKISSLSALALRIYALDANIIYEKIPSDFSVEKSESALSIARNVKQKIAD